MAEKISIITVCYNAEKTIERTIRSIINQNYPDIEYVVVDGKSTDKTIEILEKYKNYIGVIVSENDKGIYDAMNKGIALASGSYVLFLNADDYLFSADTIKNMMSIVSSDQVSDIFYGNVLMYEDNNGYAKIWKPELASSKLLYRSTLPHPSTIFKRSLFEKIGMYDDSYKIAADFEFFVRAFRESANFRYLDQLVAVFSYGGISTSGKYKKLTHDEREQILEKHFSVTQRYLLRIRVRIKKIFNV